MFSRKKLKCKLMAISFALVLVLPLGCQISQTVIEPLGKSLVLLAVIYCALFLAPDFYWGVFYYMMAKRKETNLEGQYILQYHLYSGLRSTAILYMLWYVARTYITYQIQGRLIDLVLYSIVALTLLIAGMFAHWMCKQVLKEEETK